MAELPYYIKKSSFLLYVVEKQEEVVAGLAIKNFADEDPELLAGTVTDMLAKQWLELPEKDKEKYDSQANQLISEHSEALKARKYESTFSFLVARVATFLH